MNSFQLSVRHLPLPRVVIAGLPFDAVTADEALERLCCAIRDQRRLFLSTPNLNFLMQSRRDAAFRESVWRSDLSVADGMPLVWMSRLLGQPLPQRVAGSDLFDALRAGAGTAILGRPARVYFFGGPPGAAHQAARILNNEGRGVVCVGANSAGYGDLEALSTPEVLANINASGADFLVVSLGAMKGQAWIMRNLDQLRVPVVSHLGAVVNFVAGTVVRAPLAWRRLGLEWLWRIKEEPALAGRYWSDGWAGLALILTEILPQAIRYSFRRK